MNGNSTQQHYVSTFKMRIKSSSSASSSLGNSPRSVEPRTPQRANSAGKSCRGSGGGRLVGLITLRREFSCGGVQQVALVVASQGTMEPPGATCENKLREINLVFLTDTRETSGGSPTVCCFVWCFGSRVFSVIVESWSSLRGVAVVTGRCVISAVSQYHPQFHQVPLKYFPLKTTDSLVCSIRPASQTSSLNTSFLSGPLWKRTDTKQNEGKSAIWCQKRTA